MRVNIDKDDFMLLYNPYITVCMFSKLRKHYWMSIWAKMTSIDFQLIFLLVMYGYKLYLART